MAPANRRALGVVAPGDLVEARLLAHHAAQWASRAARVSLDATPDDSQTNLGWDGGRFALVSRHIPVDGGTARFGLRLPDLTLICQGAGGAMEQLMIDDLTDADAGSWVADRLAALGLDASGLKEDLPYEVPSHAVGGGAAYRVAAQVGGLAELAVWFDLAHAVLGGMAEKYHGLKPGPSAVRCWPHHFDIATLIGLDAAGGETARSVGIGMTPGDGAYAQPYFYVTPWPYPDAARLPRLEEPAFWHTEGWVGAVIEGTAVVEIKDAEGQEEMLRGAIGNAVDCCLSILGA